MVFLCIVIPDYTCFPFFVTSRFNTYYKTHKDGRPPGLSFVTLTRCDPHSQSISDPRTVSVILRWGVPTLTPTLTDPTSSFCLARKKRGTFLVTIVQTLCYLPLISLHGKVKVELPRTVPNRLR